MAKSVVNRRLTAILAADVVGFTGLMRKDEAGTLERLKSLRKELVQPKITEFAGRIVKLMGDGLLAEFPSIVEAVQCAVDIQQLMAGRENELPDESSIKLRIGVNLGDIIVEDRDIYGDGVNIAARLESLADPGGICLSGKVYEEVRSKLSASFEDLGEKQIKNIPEPLRVFRWIGEAADQKSRRPRAEALLPILDKPSIAVLPFDNMSGDPEQEYFSDGITEDIITELSRFRSLFVIARNSSFAFKGQAIDITEIGKKLGVQFVVEGSVRKAGNRIRITAQLIETSTGNHLWAEKYDRNLDDIFAVQDEVASQIVTMVPGHIEISDRVQAMRKPVQDINAYDLVLRAGSLLDRDFGSREGEKLLKQAIEIDPEYAVPHATLGLFYGYSIFAHGSDVDEAARLACLHCETALKLDQSDPLIHAVVSEAFLMVSEFGLAEYHLDKAIALNPNDFYVMQCASVVKAYLGDYNAAIQWAEKAVLSDPYSADSNRENIFEAHYLGGQYELGLKHLIGWQDHPPHVYLIKAAAFAQLNRMEEAHEAVQQFEKIRPENWNTTNVMNAYARICAKPEDGERWLEGFRKAGLDV